MAVHPREPGASRSVDRRSTQAGAIPIEPGLDAPRRSLTRGAFADLLEASSETLWMIAAAILGDPVEAEDVLQEAAMAAIAKLDAFEPGTSFLAWMGTFVRNHARNHARKHQRRATRPSEPEALEALGEVVDLRSGRRVQRPEEELLGGLTLGPAGGLPSDLEAFDDRVLGALRQLAEEPRAALLLRVVNDLSYREVGQALGIPEGTAASHVHRARAQLREALEGEPDDEGGRQKETKIEGSTPGPRREPGSQR